MAALEFLSDSERQIHAFDLCVRKSQEKLLERTMSEIINSATYVSNFMMLES